MGCLPGCLAAGTPCYAGTGQAGLAAAPRVHNVLPGLLRNVLAELRGIALTQLKVLIIDFQNHDFLSHILLITAVCSQFLGLQIVGGLEF